MNHPKRIKLNYMMIVFMIYVIINLCSRIRVPLNTMPDLTNIYSIVESYKKSLFVPRMKYQSFYQNMGKLISML